MTRNSLQCDYVGWGLLEQFRSSLPVAENETLLFTAPAEVAPVLIRGFLTSVRSAEVQATFPPDFSENDVAEVIVEMVRTLPETLWQEWAQVGANEAVVCAKLRWSNA
jgi:hypothetical protein